MKWYWWIILFLIIVGLINMFINHLAKKKNCYHIMNSISDNESKSTQRILGVGIVIFLTLFMDSIGAFNSYVITIIYFCIMFILGGTIPKLARFMMALDYKKKGTYIDTSVTGAEKDLEDAKDKIHALGTTAGILGLFSIFGSKKKK